MTKRFLHWTVFTCTMLYLCFSVKPAIFDLFLAVGIGAYLGALYLFVLVSAVILTSQLRSKSSFAWIISSKQYLELDCENRKRQDHEIFIFFDMQQLHSNLYSFSLVYRTSARSTPPSRSWLDRSKSKATEQSKGKQVYCCQVE